MNKHVDIKQEETIYSKAEMVAIKKFNRLKSFFLNPLVIVLDKIGMTPNMVSILSALVVVSSFAFFYFSSEPYYFIVGLWIHLFLDAVDGTLARYQKKSSAKGAIFDSACDHFAIVAASFFAYMTGLIDGMNILIFAFLYSALMGIIFYLTKRKDNYFFVIRPRIYFYTALTIDSFNFFGITHYIVLLSSMIMLIEVIIGLIKILSAKKIYI